MGPVRRGALPWARPAATPAPSPFAPVAVLTAPAAVTVTARCAVTG